MRPSSTTPVAEIVWTRYSAKAAPLRNAPSTRGPQHQSPQAADSSRGRANRSHNLRIWAIEPKTASPSNQRPNKSNQYVEIPRIRRNENSRRNPAIQAASRSTRTRPIGFRLRGTVEDRPADDAYGALIRAMSFCGTSLIPSAYARFGGRSTPDERVKSRAAGAAYLKGLAAQTPVSIGNGSWDVKHVLGTVDVEQDGSAYCTVPARQAVYFQLLDEKGYVIQTMRSGTTLMPGETFRLSNNGVTEWEVYGKDVGEQGASIARTLSRN